jgi:hypothetical protein
VRYTRTSSCTPCFSWARHAYHDIVRDKPTGIYNPFHYNAESLLRDLLMQRVARCEVADAELITYGQCLGALAFATWSDEEKPCSTTGTSG